MQARERGRGEEIKKQRDVRRRIFTTARLGRQNKHSKYNYKYTCSARAHTHRCMCACAYAYGCTRVCVCVDSHEKGFFSRTCVKHLIGVSKKEGEGNKCERKMDLRIHRSVPFLFVFLFLFLFYFILLHFFFFKQPIVVVCFAFIVFVLVLEAAAAAAAPEAAQQQQEISLSSSPSSVVWSIVFFTHTRRAAHKCDCILLCVCVRT